MAFVNDARAMSFSAVRVISVVQAALQWRQILSITERCDEFRSSSSPKYHLEVSINTNKLVSLD